MTKNYLIILCFLLPTGLFAQQNLVPNPSFEDSIACPYTGWMGDCNHWYSPTAFTPDYFHSCAQNGYGVPSNGRGFQYARTGSAYAGIISMIETDSREYIQAALIDSLITGHQYEVKFYVSFAENSKYAANNIGAYFSNTPVSSGDYTFLPYIPQIENDPLSNPLTDTTGWTMVSGIYTAQGGEKYITLGNFNSDINTDTIHLNFGLSNRSYHYIDDISVVDVSVGTGINHADRNYKLNIFPNPSQGIYTIDFKNHTPLKLSLFNELGQNILTVDSDKINSKDSYTIDISSFNRGVYLLIIETQNFSIMKQLLIKH